MMADMDLADGDYGRADAAEGYSTTDDLSAKDVGYAALAAGVIGGGIALYQANESGALDEFKDYMTRPHPDGRAISAIKCIESDYADTPHHMLAHDLARVVQDTEDGSFGDYKPTTTAGWELRKAIETDFDYNPSHMTASAVAKYLQVDGNMHDGDFSAWIKDGNYIWHER